MKKLIFALLTGGLLFFISGCQNNMENPTAADQTSTKTTEAADGTIDLKLNLQPGQAYQMETEMEQSFDMQGMESKSEVNSEYTYHVKEIKDGNFIIEVTYDKLEADISRQGQNIHLGQSGGDQGSDFMRSMLGKSLTMTMNPEGKIIDMDFSNAVPGGNSQQMEELKNSLEIPMNFYPGHPVKVGDTWTVEGSIDLKIMKMTITTNCKLVSADKDTAVIDFDADIKSEGSAESASALGMNLTGRQNGSITLSRKTGLPIKGTSEQEVTGKMESRGFSMPLNIKTKIETSAKAL